MNSDNTRKVLLTISGSMLAAWIETGIRTFAKMKIKDKEDVIHITIDGMTLEPDKEYNVELLIEEEVKIIRFGQAG